MMYDLIAPIYDAVNGEIDYKLWADFFETLVEREYRSGRPELVLDLAAGTGRMTIELAHRGYDMTGVDISPEMLDLARAAAEREGVSDRILWLCQDMTEFELYGTVDFAVSCLDSINHLTTRGELRSTFSLVHNYLIPDGLFFFDINGRGKFEHIYADRTYALETEDSFCVWQNDYNPKSRLCDFYITLFHKNRDGAYDRHEDSDTERMYTIKQISRALSETGFELIGAYSDFDFTPATDDCDRIYFAARCIKN